MCTEKNRHVLSVASGTILISLCRRLCYSFKLKIPHAVSTDVLVVARIQILTGAEYLNYISNEIRFKIM